MVNEAPIRIAIGTRKGLWTAIGGPGHWEVGQPLKQMAEYSAVAWAPTDSGTPRLIVGARSWFWGPAILTSDDDGENWSEPESGAIVFPADTGASVERVWTIAPDPQQPGRVWAGAEPHSLWLSTDGGATFELNRALWAHPHRPEWRPGAGGPAVHTIVPRPDGSMVIAMSTGGVYRSADGDTDWVPANSGIRVDFAPEAYPEFGQCVHRIAMDAVDPDLLYAQNHGGVFGSQDAGTTWRPIMAGLPVDFGFMVLTHPTRSRVAWVIPIDPATMFPAQGRLRLWRTDDAGESWVETGDGLPDDCYTTVLRDAAHVIDVDGTAAIAFGTRGGSVFASVDEGQTFTEVASRLPDVLSVRAHS